MDMPAADAPRSPNRLSETQSPYLLQHAHNPVDWFPWGEEAFEKARREDKPIFLSVGYSTCHWCHVMAHESFEDPAVAAVMNELFVNVKLDREERPDVDRVYMTFVQATSGSGGWPMSVWLQPDLKPIVGGTYFPPDDRYGRRGFVSVCRTVAHAWAHDRAKVVAQGERIVEALRDYARSEAPSAGVGAAESPDAVRRAGLRALAASFDEEWGGFGHAPKFPRPVTLALLARLQAELQGEEARKAREMLFQTLDRMAAGGMHDHLGGGFHRYSVDRYWHVPHFEKMLYDQAQLTVAYLEGYQISGDERYLNVARWTLDYVEADLRSPEGGFYCAEDADSLLVAGRPEHAEGAFYVWTKAEIEALLTTEEAAVFCEHYGVQTGGNAPPESDPHGEFTGKNILFTEGLPNPEHEDPLLREARSKLLATREKRPRPHLDDKIVSAWNGLMISAFARAYQITGSEGYLDPASEAAEFVRKHLYREADGVLLRSYRQGAGTAEGFADDYAFLIQGLIDLYEGGFQIEHLRWALRLQEKQDALFYDHEGGGYFASKADDPNVLLRIKEEHDGAEPSASAVAVLNLGRLAALTGRAEFRERAERTVAAFHAAQNPGRTAQTMPLLLAGLDALSQAPRQVVVAGRLCTPEFRAMRQAIFRHYVPDKVVVWADGAEGQRELAKGLPELEGVGMRDGEVTVYLCANGACQLPTTEPGEVGRLLGNKEG